MSAAARLRPILSTALLGAMFAASAATVELAPLADGYVEFNGGTDFAATVVGNFTITRRDGINNVRNAVYEFDLGTIADASTIDAVTLYLTVNSAIATSGASLAAIAFVGYAGDGAVSVTDHQNLTVGTALTSVEFPAGTPAGTLLEIDLGTGNLDFIETLLGGNLLTLRTQTVDGVTFNIASMEKGSGAARLVIDYTPVPVPGALILCAPGVFGLWIARRKRG